MSRAIAVAAKALKEFYRNPRTAILTLGLPVVFMLIFGLAFGGDGGPATRDLAVLDLDEGEHGSNLTRILRAADYDDGTPIFALRAVNASDEGLALVKDRSVAAFVLIPANFSAAVDAQLAPYRAQPGPAGVQLPPTSGGGPREDTGPYTRVEIHGNPSSTAFGIAERIVGGILATYVQAYAPVQPHATPETKSVALGSLSEFDFMVPGLMVFAIINTAPAAAAVLAQEEELRTLRRLRLSTMRTWDLLAGVTLAQSVIALAGVLLMFGTALLMGFETGGSLALAMLAAFVASLAVIGLGMVIAAFATTRADAANLGTLVGVPASFLSGAFFPMPAVVLFRAFGREVEAYDLLPTRHAVDAMQAVLTFGLGWDDIAFSLAMLLALALALFAVGVALYANRRLRAAP